MLVRSLRGAAHLHPPGLPLSRPSETANDNTAVGRGGARSVWREILFLGILAASLYGAFTAGRSNASHKVIVVPGPIGFYSLVT